MESIQVFANKKLSKQSNLQMGQMTWTEISKKKIKNGQWAYENMLYITNN